MQSPTSPIPPNTEHTKYCTISTPLGTICPNELPMSLHSDDNDKEEERKDQNEEDKKIVKGRLLKPAQILTGYYLYSSAPQILHQTVQQEVQCDA